MSGPNLVILTETGEMLSCGQVQIEVKFDFHVEFDLESQSRPPPKIIGILTIVFCIFDPNLVVLGSTGNELSCGQASGWYTHTRTDTDACDDNTRGPKLASGKNCKNTNENVVQEANKTN